MKSARETAAEAESICSTPLCSPMLSPNHISVSGKERESTKETERGREKQPVASSGVCSQISIRLMSQAPGLLPLLLMLLPREGVEISCAKVWLHVATAWSNSA